MLLDDSLAGEAVGARTKGRQGSGSLFHRVQKGRLGPLLALALIRGPERPGLRIIGISGQRPTQSQHRAHAVEQRVVHLGVHRETAILKPLDQMHLPQRTVPVQQRAVQPRGQLQELANPPRVGQR